jgi:hypothetical protein
LYRVPAPPPEMAAEQHVARQARGGVVDAHCW